VPKANVTPAVRSRPIVMNHRGLLRSDTDPMMNFETP
jgi:hypothetical protein